MRQPLYWFLTWVADESGLTWLLERYEIQVLAAIAVLGALCCLAGFYCYRGLVSGLVLLAVILASFLWIDPAWGLRAAATVCAVVGVVLGFLAFRWYKLGAVALCALMAADRMWLLLGSTGLPPAVRVICLLAAAVLAGLFTGYFPLWGVCGFTALWGATVFAEEGRIWWGSLPVVSALPAAAVAAVLTLAGLAVQLRVFRGQRLFPRIMPGWMENWLERRKRGRAS